jgi:hypothetical protein
LPLVETAILHDGTQILKLFINEYRKTLNKYYRKQYVPEMKVQMPW